MTMQIVERGNIPLVENPYVISARAVCFSPLFVCYYSSILDIIHSWRYRWLINSFYVYSIVLLSHIDGFLSFLRSSRHELADLRLDRWQLASKVTVAYDYITTTRSSRTEACCLSFKSKDELRRYLLLCTLWIGMND